MYKSFSRIILINIHFYGKMSDVILLFYYIKIKLFSYSDTLIYKSYERIQRRYIRMIESRWRWEYGIPIFISRR